MRRANGANVDLTMGLDVAGQCAARHKLLDYSSVAAVPPMGDCPPDSHPAAYVANLQ